MRVYRHSARPEVNPTTQAIIRNIRKASQNFIDNGAKIGGAATLMLTYTWLLYQESHSAKTTDNIIVDFLNRHLNEIDAILFFMIAAPPMMNITSRIDDLLLNEKTFRLRQLQNRIFSIKHQHAIFHRHAHHEENPTPINALTDYPHNEFKIMVIAIAMMAEYLFSFVDSKDRSLAMIIAYLALTRLFAMTGVVFADRLDEVAWDPAVIRERHRENISMWNSGVNFFQRLVEPGNDAVVVILEESNVTNEPFRL
jgi:hypothetical protein